MSSDEDSQEATDEPLAIPQTALQDEEMEEEEEEQPVGIGVKAPPPEGQVASFGAGNDNQCIVVQQVSVFCFAAMEPS